MRAIGSPVGASESLSVAIRERARLPEAEEKVIRDLLKLGAEHVLASAPVGRVARWRVSGKRLILAYHGVMPTGAREPFAVERALFVTQEVFAAQLELLKRICDVATLEEIAGAGDGRPRVAITFDDAYRGAVTAAIDELEARRLPVTIFVAPGRLDRHVFWWDALAAADGVLDADLRRYALDVLGGDDERVRAWAETQRLPVCLDQPGYARSATTGELESAARRFGVTFGSHGWSHASLPMLARSALTAELERSLEWIRGRFGLRSIPWLAYPYGRHSRDVSDAARATGYDAALVINGGWHIPDRSTRFAVPRLNVGGSLSLAGFRARILGTIGS